MWNCLIVKVSVLLLIKVLIKIGELFMKAKVINVISKEIDNGIAKYYVYKFVIDKPIDKLSDGRMIIDNTFALTEYAARKYNVNASIVGKTIDFDIVYHKAGDTYKTPWGETLKFKNDCTQVVINGYE